MKRRPLRQLEGDQHGRQLLPWRLLPRRRDAHGELRHDARLHRAQHPPAVVIDRGEHSADIVATFLGQLIACVRARRCGGRSAGLSV
jgi:hypothetical protein